MYIWNKEYRFKIKIYEEFDKNLFYIFIKMYDCHPALILILNSLFIRILEQGEQDRSRERKEVVRQKEMSI